MQFCFCPLTQENARIIADSWKYEGEYAFYDMTADPEDYAEFVDPVLRNESDCLEAKSGNELAGYFSVSRDGDALEIGLGLKPSHCGKGLGREFVNQILQYLEKHYAFRRITLIVAEFNLRAQKVYRSCGFVITEKFVQQTNGGEYPFLRMERQR